MRSLTPVAVVAALLLTAGLAHGQPDAARANALVRELKNPDFERANAALSELAKAERPTPQVVAGMLDAVRTGAWQRCSGDMRDSLARTLGDWKVKAAVAPLLELVKSGKAIEHECAQ